METRVFGRTGMRLSVLGFGCDAVGGLMVRGNPLDQERTIARAIASGVNYFDTAVQYGNGESQRIRPHSAKAQTGQRGRRHQGPAAECRLRRHCRRRGEVARRQSGATPPRGYRTKSNWPTNDLPTISVNQMGTFMRE